MGFPEEGKGVTNTTSESHSSNRESPTRKSSSMKDRQNRAVSPMQVGPTIVFFKWFLM